jgi:hypothetical protein
VPIISPEGLSSELISKIFRLYDDLTLRFVRDSYLRDFCLYFPGPVIYAACLLIADQIINQIKLPMDLTGS